jgi:Holliday junction resolvasome RuvABC endonuclease subunit
MTLILGVDPSARKVAFIAFETITQTFNAHAVKLYAKGETKQTNDSLCRCLEVVRHYATGLVPSAVGQPFAFVEEPLLGGRVNVAATIKQSYVGGIVRACLVEAGFVVYDVHPSTWRKTLGITGTSTAVLKTATAQVVRDRLPKVYQEVSSDGDLIDAAAIALHGIEQVRQGVAIARLAKSVVQGSGPDLVVRPARVRRRVRGT